MSKTQGSALPVVSKIHWGPGTCTPMDEGDDCLMTSYLLWGLEQPGNDIECMLLRSAPVTDSVDSMHFGLSPPASPSWMLFP